MIAAALEIEPGNPNGLWMMGLVEFQRDNYAEALGLWSKLEAQLTPGGEDISALQGYMAEARRQAEIAGLTNIEFEARDLSDFEHSAETERFDFVTAFDAVHDQAVPQGVLNGIYKTLKTGATFLQGVIFRRLSRSCRDPCSR